MTGPPPPDANPWAVPSGQQPPTPATGPPPAYGPPPGYAQQPAYWPVYPSAQRPRRRWLPWVIVAVLLTVGGCGALVATAGVHFYKQMDGAQMAVDDFLSAIERGDMAAAEALICDEAGPAEAERAASSGITQHRVVSAHVQSNSGFGSDRPTHTSASVTVDVTLAGGIRHRDVVNVEYEHQQWLVCGVLSSDVRD